MDKTIRQIITRAKKDPVVVAIALFGSYARKERYKDIDICLFLKPGKYTPKQLSEKKLEYTPENEKYDVQIFQQLPVYIRVRVFKDAQFLYKADEAAIYDLYFALEREYEHFKPIYENYLAGVMAHG